MLRGDDIDPLALFEMYDWTCVLCNEKIDSQLRCPDPMAATIEHLVPLSKGGTHTWDNCAPAHGKCNWDKSNGLL